MAPNPQQTYEDFEPPVERSEEDGCSLLTLYIPGFSKEGIKVQVSSTRKLRVSGERDYRNNTRQRFYKEFQIPSDCEMSKITAKYKGGILSIRQPWRGVETKPPNAAQQQSASSEANNGKQRPGAAEKKSAVAGQEKVEAKSSEERQETTNNASGGKDTVERANISSKKITTSGAAGGLKEVIPRIMVKVVLPTLLAVLLFLCAKRLIPAMFVGVGEPPAPH